MTVDELKALTTPAGSDEREGRVHLPLIGGEVDLVVWGTLGPAHADALKGMLALGPERLPELRDLVAKDARFRGEDMAHDRWMELPEDQRAARPLWRVFGLNDDGSPPEDWPFLDWLTHLDIGDYPVPARAVLRFVPPWEEEHGFSVELKSGRLTWAMDA